MKVDERDDDEDSQRRAPASSPPLGAGELTPRASVAAGSRHASQVSIDLHVALLGSGHLGYSTCTLTVEAWSSDHWLSCPPRTRLVSYLPSELFAALLTRTRPLPPSPVPPSHTPPIHAAFDHSGLGVD